MDAVAAVEVEGGASVATIAKQIKFVQPGLIEGGWKLHDAGAWFLERIQKGKWLFHPYTQVRKSVAQVAYLVTRNYYTYGDGQTHPSLQAFLDYVVGELSTFSYLKMEASEVLRYA